MNIQRLLIGALLTLTSSVEVFAQQTYEEMP